MYLSVLCNCIFHVLIHRLNINGDTRKRPKIMQFNTHKLSKEDRFCALIKVILIE